MVTFGAPHEDLADLARLALAAVVAGRLEGHPGYARPQVPSSGVPIAVSSWRRHVTTDEVSVAP